MTSDTTTPLHQIARIRAGGTLQLTGKHFVAAGVPAYGAGGLNGYVTTTEYEGSAIILSSIGARCGKCFYVDGEWTSLANTQVILPDPERVYAKFLWYQLNNEHRWHRSGTAQPFIKPSDVANSRVFLPSLAKQRRIAEVLDQADALRVRRRESLSLLNDLTQSIFLDMFGHPSASDLRWPTAPLGEIARTTSGGTPSRAIRGNYGGQVPWVKSGELHGGVVTKTEEHLTERGLADSSAKLMPAGTVLVAMYGATAGVIARLGIPAATNQAVCSIEVGSRLDAEFLRRTLKLLTPKLLSQRVGGAQPNLSQGAIRALRVPTPPVDLQHEFAERIRAAEMLSEHQAQHSRRLDHLFASLQQRAFAGQFSFDMIAVTGPIGTA